MLGLSLYIAVCLSFEMSANLKVFMEVSFYSGQGNFSISLHLCCPVTSVTDFVDASQIC